jgi:hypothetical protein
VLRGSMQQHWEAAQWLAVAPCAPGLKESKLVQWQRSGSCPVRVWRQLNVYASSLWLKLSACVAGELLR